MFHLLRRSLFCVVPAVFGMALVIPPLIPNHPAQAQNPMTPRFEPAKCPFDVPPRFTEGRDLRCGTVFVPENRSRPDSPEIALAVAIFKARSDTPSADPVMYLEGGPGGWVLRFSGFYVERLAPLLQTRDVILLDQRGNGYSTPLLDCPELTRLAYDELESFSTLEERNRRFRETAVSCAARLAQEGVDLTAYHTGENAADIDAVRQALGYEQVNLYGVSYGTRLALTVMRDYPQGIRSVILDSVVPLEVDFYAQVATYAERAFDALFEACAADPACNSAYPELEAMFYDLVALLNLSPALVKVEGSPSGTRQIHLDGYDLIDVLFGSLYSTETVPLLPAYIYGAGDYEDYTFFATELLNDASQTQFFSEGTFYSTDCHEEVPFTTLEAIRASSQAVEPVLREYYADGGIVEFCRSWQVGQAAAVDDRPVQSPLPALIFSGHFDPITPPVYAQKVAAALPASFYFNVANGGHAPSLDSTCAMRMVRDFLDNPAVIPNAACLAELTVSFR